MTTSLVWPRTLLVPSEVALNLSPNGMSGGPNLLGYEQVVFSSAGRWTLTYGGIFIHTTAQVKAWNALAARLSGRLNPILAYIYDSRQAPSPAVTATIDGDVSAGDVNISIAVTGGTIEEGMHWSNSFHEGLYVIRKINSLVAGTYDVDVWPPLRHDISDTAACEFALPRFRVKLASDNEMDVALDLRRYASPTVRFVEDVTG